MRSKLSPTPVTNLYTMYEVKTYCSCFTNCLVLLVIALHGRFWFCISRNPSIEPVSDTERLGRPLQANRWRNKFGLGAFPETHAVSTSVRPPRHPGDRGEYTARCWWLRGLVPRCVFSSQCFRWHPPRWQSVCRVCQKTWRQNSRC